VMLDKLLLWWPCYSGPVWNPVVRVVAFVHGKWLELW